MYFRSAILTLAILLAACSAKQASPGFSAAPVAATAAAKVAAQQRTLAYEHALQIDAAQEKIPPLFAAARAACLAAQADACTELSSQAESGRDASASLTFRARPAGIGKLIATLSAQGQVISQSTKAEDLAGPIEDASKKLAMLTDYRDKLEGLRVRASTDIDALIKVNRELAQVQGELEAATGTQAHLMQRVDTEILRVSIRSHHSQSFLAPITFACADFGRNLAQGISSAITGLAFLIPWLIMLAAFGWAARKLWRRRKAQRDKA